MTVEISQHELVQQLVRLGVRRGGVLLVHTSFRAVAPVAGGPLGLIAALTEVLGPEGTLVMPSMTDGESVFDPRSTPTSDMGITAELFWRQPGVLRSDHPGGSFAARGPAASYLTRPQRLSPPHGPDSPVGRVLELDGQVLLLGVTQGESTMLHVAEALASVPYAVSYPTVLADGSVAMIAETDHCCRNFCQADAWLRARGQQEEGKVGHAHSRLYDAKHVVAAALEQLARDPLFFLCASDAGCAECDAARASALPNLT